MRNDTTGRHCHNCSASGDSARLTLRTYCTMCAKRIDEHDLYFHIPKPFTVNGLRTQVRGLRCFLQAAYLSAAGRTPAARERGRLYSLKLAATVWIDQWHLLRNAGWRR